LKHRILSFGVIFLNKNLVLPGHEIHPFREAVFEPKGEEGVDMTLEISGHRSATRFGKVDGRHGQHEAVQVIALASTKMDLE